MQQFRKTLIVLLALSFTFGFQSCKKDEDSPSRTELLTTEAGWTLQNTAGNSDEIADAIIALVFQITPAELQTPELEAELRAGFDFEDFFETEECDNDDITFFNANGNMIEDEGAVKCDEGSPQSNTVGTWSFSTDEKQLIVTDTQDGEVRAFEVITINSSTLTIQSSIALEGSLDLEYLEDIEGLGDLGDIEGLDDYDELLAKDFTLNFTFKAN